MDVAKSLVQTIEAIEQNGHENPRLLNPGATPDSLKTFRLAIGCPCPTRMMSRETAAALRALALPMFANPTMYSPDSLEVGDARNKIVEYAIRDGMEWLFFLDYDVIPPPNAIARLLKWKAGVAAGVYHSKSAPSYPLLMIRGMNHCFEDYETGDLILVDGVGMGCTLIHMSVFDKIEKPYFRTVPGYLKDRQYGPMMTEDIYFCDKVRDAGVEILVDTSIQCGHVDSMSGLVYHRLADPNNPRRGAPGWLYKIGESVVSELIPSPDHPGIRKLEPKPTIATGMKLDLGSGANPPPGYIGIDLYAESPNVIKGTIENLAWFREQHGLVDEIRASHSLEHMNRASMAVIFRDWVNTLKPGGVMNVEVPDIEGHIRRIVELLDQGDELNPENEYHFAALYGWQVGEGQEHKIGFTSRRLEQLAVGCGLTDVVVERVSAESSGNVVNGAPTTIWVLRLTGRRPGVEPKKRGRPRRTKKEITNG